jgi:PPP family 3-phenylpropionic acid transporter
MKKFPYWPLSSFYFFYFSVLGGFMPYWGLYLERQLGFTPALIGQLMAITVATRIVAPNFWGYVADHTGKRLQLVRLGALMLMLFWCGIFFVRGFWAVTFVLLGYSFFQNAILAQFEAVTVAHLGARREFYGRVRLWGSLGFIAAVGGLGTLFDHVSLRWLPAVLALCALASWLASLWVPDIATTKRADAKTSLRAILRRPVVYGFLGASFMIEISHAPYYTFYSIFLEAHHYSRTAIGWLWALGVAGEVVAFTQTHRIVPALGERRVMLISLLLAALRWLVIGLAVDHPAVLVVMQLLHAATFATFHSAVISLIYRHFGDGHQGQGQALYSMLWGLGVAVGSFIAGQVWTSVGPTLIYAAAAGVCLIAWAWVYVLVRETPTPVVVEG